MKLYQTQDTALAITLNTLGVPWAKDDSGNERPIFHLYTAAVLKKLGYKGWELEAAARDAWEKKRMGVLFYCFERTALCEEIIEAYFKHALTIRRAEEKNRPLSLNLSLDVATAAKLACQLFKNRRHFVPAELCKAHVPWIAIDGECETEERDFTNEQGKTLRGTVSIGSFKAISLAASAETRQKLGIS